MGPRPATIIVESRLLMRDALKSLMARHSYQIVCDVGSIAEIGNATIPDEPKLVILGAQSANNALVEAVSAHKMWPDSKIILLYERATPADFQRFLTSHIDGCVLLFVSPDTLIRILDMIMIADVRVMVAADAKPIRPAQSDESHRSDIEAEKFQLDGAEHEDVSVGIFAMPTQLAVNGAGTFDVITSTGSAQCLPTLSKREAQILDSLMKGHANKVIARTCDITEATVKVHMKSILRKIRVNNRTQAAIWAKEAMQPGEFKGRLLKLASALWR